MRLLRKRRITVQPRVAPVQQRSNPGETSDAWGRSKWHWHSAPRGRGILTRGISRLLTPHWQLIKRLTFPSRKVEARRSGRPSLFTSPIATVAITAPLDAGASGSRISG
jgi:hypothetical protein